MPIRAPYRAGPGTTGKIGKGTFASRSMSLNFP